MLTWSTDIGPGCCRFVVSQCNYLLRDPDWVEARVRLGMPPLPPWEHGNPLTLSAWLL